MKDDKRIESCLEFIVILLTKQETTFVKSSKLLDNIINIG